MRSRSITEPSDSSGAFPDSAEEGFYTSNLHVRGGGNPPAGTPVEIPSTPALTSEATESLAAQNGPTSTVSLVAGGITINLLFDAAAMAAPASFRAGIQEAASLLTAAISDQITVNIKIDYSGTGGGAFAGPDNGLYESYSTVRAQLTSNATPGDTTFNALPAGSSIQGQTNVAVWNAQLKLWGVLGANDTTTDDGSATFSTDIDTNLLVGVALHELTHAMGRVPYGPTPDIFDLFRFTSAGVRLFSGGDTAPPAYFSLDGGNIKLADYATSDPGDFLNSGVQGPNDLLNAFYGSGTIQSLSAVDKAQLDALGFHTMTPTTIEAFGSTSLVQVGSNYFFNPGPGVTGPELKYAGAAVVAGQFGPYTPIGVEQTTGGYEVALHNSSANQFSIWNTDSNGNFVSFNVYSDTSTALESLETSFHQDLNGDGVIGIPAPVMSSIEAFGSTSLVQVGSNYFFNPGPGITGPELKYAGAAVTAGQFAPYTLIGVEQTAGGYEVALHNASANQFSIWNTDSNGNFVSFNVYSGTSTALESLETSFHQDLNGDGAIGIPAPVMTSIEAFGSTSLVQIGSNYFFNPGPGITGPELKFAGAVVFAGQFAPYTPIGVEQTTGGYEVALHNASANQFSIWNTDSNGNFVSFNVYSGTSTALESLETSFHQDLNGDGVIGIPAPVMSSIEAFGSTSLVQVGSNYFFNPGPGITGPESKFAGAAVFAGQFGPYTPIGVEQTAGGYEVALHNSSANQFSIWNTDSNGNFVSFNVYSDTSTALESLETSFHQDLNGDGVIGIPNTTGPVAAAPVSHVVSVASNDTFVFQSSGASNVANIADKMELHEFSPSENHQTSLFKTVHTDQSQASFQWVNGGHDSFADPVNHDSMTWTDAHLANVHGNGFIV